MFLIKLSASGRTQKKMENEIPRYSSCIGEAWMHGMFKIKFCHPIFDKKEIREYCEKLLNEASEKYKIKISELGFDNNHVHILLDIGLYNRPQVAKMLKGYTARKLFEQFPWMKKPKKEGGLFWNSGLWNPSYYLESPKNMARIIKYIRKQKYGKSSIEQKTLLAY